MLQFHDFVVSGEIKKIQVSTPKDPKKDPSAVILVQYGETRDPTHGAVEFLNAAMVRIPNYKYPQLKDKLKVGSMVKVQGHIQGIFKTIMDEGIFSTELVADRVFVDGGPRGQRAKPAAEAPAEAPEAE